jgi:hypothetical protein
MTLDLSHVCATHPDRYQCPDALIDYSARFDEYGIIVHDGDISSVKISYCPWCGAELPPSRRAEWFDELAKLGISDPTEDELPPKYRGDGWYRGPRSGS